LIALGEPAPVAKREAVQALAKHVGFDAAAVTQVLDVRERRAKLKKMDVQGLCARYLEAVEHVAAAVDKALEAE
jgi:uncharacterized protein (UPF0335 family)